MTALWLSWLQSLSDQLINKPSPRNLAGAGFSRAEWIANAMKVGISSVIFEQDSQLELQNIFLPSISMLLIGESFELDPNSTNIFDGELRGITALTTRISSFQVASTSVLILISRMANGVLTTATLSLIR